MIRLLVTTALEETWDAHREILFLGKWCKLYSRKNLWETLRSETLPYHWDDRDKLYKDYQTVSGIYERVLVDLGKKMNGIHNVNYDTRYWRILLGMWLGYFLQILFDRWYTIQQATAGGETFETIALEFDPASTIPNDMDDFNRQYVSDEWNHYIYLSILKKKQSVEIITKKNSQSISGRKVIQIQKTSLSKQLKRKAAAAYLRFIHLIGNKNRPLFIATYLSFNDLVKLSRRFSQLPLLPNVTKPARTAPDQAARKWTLTGESSSEFEDFARQMIPGQLPVSYLEGYTALVHQADAMPWPQKPSVIFTSNSFSSDDIFKVYAAQKTAIGTPLVIGQHGGHYGAGKWNFSEEHEIDISNRYLSWGWNKTGQPKVHAVGQIKFPKPVALKADSEQKAFLVTMTQPRYSYWMYSIIAAGQWENYFADQCEFVKALCPLVYNELRVRLYPVDYGWSQLQRWKDIFPAIQIDPGVQTLQEQMSNCRIFISTYNATTFLESFSMNVPSVLYWNPAHWELRDSAVPYYEALKRVGVLHDTPVSAAQHVNKIWSDVNAWWSSPEVKQAVAFFSQQFCNTNGQLLDNIENCLREVIAEAKIAS